MPSHRSARSISRRSSPASPPKPPSSVPSTRLTRRSARSESRELGDQASTRKGTSNLLPVNEEDTIEVAFVNKPNSEREQDENVELDEVQTLESSYASSYSSDTSDRLSALDPDLMIDNITSLYQDSNAVLRLLEVGDLPTIIDELHVPSSISSKRFRNFTTRLVNSISPYGDYAKDVGRLFLDASLIVRRLANKRDWVDVPEGPWRPDWVLHQANLALLLRHLLVGTVQETKDTVSLLFNHLPSPLIDFGTYPELREIMEQETISFALSICTQLFIIAVERESLNLAAFDPDKSLKDVFLNDEDAPRCATYSRNSRSKAVKAFTIRIGELSSNFSVDSESPFGIEALRKKFPWKRFVREAAVWISQLRKQLEIRIVAQGGIYSIYDSLEAREYSEPIRDRSLAIAVAQEKAQSANEATEIQTHHEIHQSTAITPVRAQKATNRDKTREMKKMMMKMKARDAEFRKRMSGSTANSDAPTLDVRSAMSPSKSRREIPATHDQAEDDHGHFVDEERDPEPEVSNNDEGTNIQRTVPSIPRSPGGRILSSQAVEAVLAKAKQQQGRSEKENTERFGRVAKRFIDPQAHAERLSWDSPGSVAGGVGKHDRTDRDSDESEDFETDDRLPKRSRTTIPGERREAIPPADDSPVANLSGDETDDPEQLAASQQLRSDSHNVQLTHRVDSHSSSQPARELAPPSTQRTSVRPPPSTAPSACPRPRQSICSDEPSSTPAQKYINIKQDAKRNMLQYRKGNPTVSATRQVRRAWDAGEIERLIELMGEHGCKWSTILDADKEHIDGPLLDRRGQVQLKDKARNMKFDYLKSHTAMPDCFDQVTMKTSDLLLLKEMGVRTGQELAE